MENEYLRDLLYSSRYAFSDLFLTCSSLGQYESSCRQHHYQRQLHSVPRLMTFVSLEPLHFNFSHMYDNLRQQKLFCETNFKRSSCKVKIIKLNLLLSPSPSPSPPSKKVSSPVPHSRPSLKNPKTPKQILWTGSDIIITWKT